MLIMNATSAIATRNYAVAILYLNVINPDSSCNAEAQKLVKEIDSKITAVEKRELEAKQKEYNDQMQLKRDSINAAKEIAIEYAKNRPTVNYLLLIK